MHTKLSVRHICLLVFAILLISILANGAAWDYGVEPYSKWSLAKAVAILNSEPWARQETFTRVVPGVGSGVSGEKEIYNTFYVRFLSARPIREAYARVQQIQHGYEDLTEEQKKRFDQILQPGLDMNVDRWLVVAVSFRSNDPAEESTVRRFLQSQTRETLKTLAFLSTPENPQIELAAYYPPREESVGAKFIFPRSLDGSPIVDTNTEQITFELLDVPGANPRLRATFFTKEMVSDGKVIL
jgi:hypothetical protein